MSDSITNLFHDQDYDRLRRLLRESEIFQMQGPNIKVPELFEDYRFNKTLDNIDKFNADGVVWLRPDEISKSHNISPSFVLDGLSRFDVNQGKLGDCWFLANLSNLAENKTLFDRVVPQNQSFDEGIYKGIFRFRFYRCNLTASDLYRHVIVFFTGSINGWRL